MMITKNTLLIGMIVATHVINAEQEFFKVVVEPRWQNLEQNSERCKQFGGKWILAGSITYRKH